MNQALADVLYRVAIASVVRSVFALSWCLMLAHFARSNPGVYLPGIAAAFLAVAAIRAGQALRHEVIRPNPNEAVTWYSHSLSDLIVAWAIFEIWQLLGSPST